MEITPVMLKAFRAEFDTLTAELGKKYGVKLSIGSISYSQNEFSGRLKGTALTPSGEKKVDTALFDMYKKMLGLKCDLGFEFTDRRGELLRVVDIDPRKPKNAVSLVGVLSGKGYKAPVAYINQHVN